MTESELIQAIAELTEKISITIKFSRDNINGICDLIGQRRELREQLAVIQARGKE